MVRSPATPVRAGLGIEVSGLVKTVAGGTRVLDGVSLRIAPGQVAAIVGGSGAGKTTLLEAIAGIRPADEGTVLFDGVDSREQRERLRALLGYVPQDDIIHTELPLERTLRYAARLRMPPATANEEIEAAIEHALDALDLRARAEARVGALSGGQRKRASIAVELLTSPRVFFLDEPTSGLDPATSAQLMRLLRRLAEDGSTVVLTTHAVQDLSFCDQVVFLAGGGRLAFAGALDAALARFGTDSVERIYERLSGDDLDAGRVDGPHEDGEAAGPELVAAAAAAPALEGAGRPGAFRQWQVLTRRTFETLVRNRLTLAILIGSPALVVAMFVVLFRPGAFDFDSPEPSATVMIIFWIVFGGFFFGLTYGLLQIVTELPVLRRERLIGLNLGAYLLSKVAVLLPFLLLVDVLMLGILRLLERLPAAGLDVYGSLGVTLALDAAAALALGLLTSAAVSTPAQATLALPMLCFPAVLFSGAILPVNVMATAGQALSALMPDRWAFEAVGSALGLRELFAEGGSPLGPPLLASYGDAGTSSVGAYWLILVGFFVSFLALAWLTLIRRSRNTER